MRTRSALAIMIGALTFLPDRAAAQQVITYSYDVLGRLVTTTHATGPTVTYSYDPVGNRLGKITGTGGTGGGNQNPIAAADYFEMRTSQTSVLPVLANDSDPNGNPLSISAVTQPTTGTATITSGGASISYTASGVAGVKTFSYTVVDGQGGSATATVELLVRKPAGYCQRYPDDPLC